MTKREALCSLAAKLFPLVIFAVCLTGLAGCVAPDTGELTADYSDAEILITGLTEEGFTVTVAELAALPQSERSASAQRSNGQKVNVDAVGPLLADFLAAYGVKQSDFTAIRFSAADNYSITVGPDVLANREIVLALADGREALLPEDQPVRVVIPGERAMYWVRNLVRIDFSSGEATTACNRLVFLAAAVQTLNSQDYDYNGVADQAVAVGDLLDAYALDTAAETVAISAADGLGKTEAATDLRTGLLKYTGADAPRFLSQVLPEGMETYNIIVISYGGTAILTLDKLTSLYGGTAGLDFFTLAGLVNMPAAEAYLLRGLDGTETNLGVDDLAGALLNQDEAGTITLTLESGRAINGLLLIEGAA